MVKMIDNYTLLQIIGEGNFGKVYRAKNVKSNQEFAIKIIPSDKLHQNSKLQECTMNEIQTLTTIGQTDHIIMYYEMLKTKNNYYFVYEFCNGGTLMEMLAKQHHLQERGALDIFKQLLEAFKVLNRLNIMHRDLKPENIFFTDNKVKLGDFGFCKGLKPEENLTKTMLGSPIYMAPEVLKGQAYSTKADIWSLGVILYEMLYGVCPFQSSSIAMLINTINSQQIVLPSNIKVTQKTQQLLRKLLTKDYFRRIGWIELFNWFGEEGGQQKQNVFKNTSQNCSVLEKKAILVEEWVSKNKITQLNVKERSISQDISKKDKGRVNIGSLQNISPSNFQQKNIPFTPKLGEQNKNGQASEPGNSFANQHKSYSAIRQPSSVSSPFQAYKKPASLPKRQTATIQQSGYGHSSCYKPESIKKIFYSQNYQNIFSTPISQKANKINDSSIEILEKDMLAKQCTGNIQMYNTGPSSGNKNVGNQRVSLTKASMVNSRANSSFISSGMGNKNLKEIKIQNAKIKRKQLLQIHQECLNVLKTTFNKLQQKKQNYLRIAYLVLSVVLEKLKEITKFINIIEIDLLDISSLINYEIIQVDRMIIDIREQILNSFQIIPTKNEQILQAFQFDESGQQKIIKDFIQNRINRYEVQKNERNRASNAFAQNTSIVNMLPSSATKDQERFESSGVYGNQMQSTKYNKGQYYTTNQFAQYYKNLIQSKQRNSNSKILMQS